MRKITILVMITPTDKNAIPFREAIEGNVKLRSRVELRFATAEDAPSLIQEAEVVECLKLPAEWSIEPDSVGRDCGPDRPVVD